jgi:hypothetical protein
LVDAPDLKFDTWWQLDYACNCLGKRSCAVNYEEEYFKFDSNCQNIAQTRIENALRDPQNRDSNIPVPNLFFITECIADNILNPISDSPMTKQQMGLVVVFIDMIMIVLFLIFIEGLEHSQKAYVSKFKDQTIEMTDFAIRVKNLPANN